MPDNMVEVQNLTKIYRRGPIEIKPLENLSLSVAEGDFVAVRVAASFKTKDREGDMELMQLHRFENGKIAELWEYLNPKDLED